MDDFTLQRSLARVILRERPTVRDGMTLLLEKLVAAPHGKAWRACADIDWPGAFDAWVAWLDTLLAKHPLPRSTQLLWFEAPSEINRAFTSVSAYDAIGPADDGYGTNESRTWPCDDEGTTLPAGLHDLPEVEEALVRAGFRDESDADTPDALLRSVYAFCYCCPLLFVLNGLPASRALASVDAPRGLGVVYGWAAGDADAVGQLTSKGWGPIRRVRADVKPEELDPESLSFRLGKYLERGLDPNVRVKDGRTLLMKHWTSPDTEIFQLLDRGASVHAVSADGSGVLHHFGAAQIPILRRLLDAKPDVNLVNQHGVSVLDRVIDDGRCTLAHVELFQSVGARLSRHAGPDSTPVHIIAGSSVYKRERLAAQSAMLKHWLAQGFDVNARDAEGATPLWIALARHTREIASRMKDLLKNPESEGYWDYQHDKIAMLLLEHGADANDVHRAPKDALIPAGATPLMARRYDDTTLVKALLKHGADPLATCAKGRTALHYAEEAAGDARRIDRVGAAEVAAVLRTAMKKAERGGGRSGG